MGLPAEVIARIPSEGAIVALRMNVDNKLKDVFFRVLTKEGPNNLIDHSLGSVDAQAVAGSAWNEIVDSQGAYLLEPEFRQYLYQIFYGIWPSYIRIYKQYPSGVDRGSLRGTRTPTGSVGFIRGEDSPITSPSAQTELWTLEGTHPSFFAYHPHPVPASETVRMSFFVTKFLVSVIKAPTVEESRSAIQRTMGGTTLFEAPLWVR